MSIIADLTVMLVAAITPAVVAPIAPPRHPLCCHNLLVTTHDSTTIHLPLTMHPQPKT